MDERPGRGGRLDDRDQPSTGEPAVDAALAALAALDQRPVTDHPELLARVHRDLDAALRAAADDEPATGHG